MCHDCLLSGDCTAVRKAKAAVVVGGRSRGVFSKGGAQMEEYMIFLIWAILCILERKAACRTPTLGFIEDLLENISFVPN